MRNGPSLCLLKISYHPHFLCGRGDRSYQDATIKTFYNHIIIILKFNLSVSLSVCPLREVTGGRLDPESQVGVSKHREAWTYSVLRPLPARAGSGLLQYDLTYDKASSLARQLPCNTREWPGTYKNITLTKTKCYEASPQGGRLHGAYCIYSTEHLSRPWKAWRGDFMAYIHT